MRQPSLTVVVPFYDETQFIDTAIRSITGQAIPGCEIIVVNDQPERFDRSFFAGFDWPDSVRLVEHHRNRGLSAARNTGIAAATGDHVAFLDADDYFVTDGLKRQFDYACLTGADITHAQAYRSPQGTPEVEILRRDKLMFGARKSGRGLDVMDEAQFFTSSWSSLYKRRFLAEAGLAFDEEQRKFEDRLFVLQTVTAARYIALLGEPVRVWRGRAGSISVTRTDADTRRLQLQLLEKCMAHVRTALAAGTLAPRFAKRELFNTVSRLIWDIDLVEAIAKGLDPEADALGQRVRALLGADSFGQQIFDDPVIQPISRIGMRSRKGRISRVDFFNLHKFFREGRFVEALALVERRMAEAADRPAAPALRRIPAERRLILHVGMHKTGSTHVQRQLQAHRRTLAARGILVPRTGEGFGPERGVRPEGYPGHLGLFRAARFGNGEIREAFHEEVQRSNCRDVLVSCENMLAPMAEDREAQLSKLFDFFAPFEDRRVIAFVRRPDRWFDSFYREIVVNGMRSGARSIGEFAVDYEPVLFDLPALFAPFELFARSRVAFADYDLARANGGVWPAFLDLAGIADAVGDACPAEDIAVYPSQGRAEVQAAQTVNALIPDRERRRDILAAFFAESPQGGGPDAPFLPPSERLRQLDRFEELSRDFVLDRGFSPALTEWRRQLSNEVWSPSAAIPAELVARLVRAGFYSERPATRRPLPRTPLKPVPVRIHDGALVLRIRPRPWVRRTIAWLKSPNLPRFAAGPARSAGLDEEHGKGTGRAERGI